MAASLVLSDSAGPGITLLTLNRAEKRNALSLELIQELTQALDRLRGGTRVVVLAAAGNTFCAGHDLAEMTGRHQ